MSPAVQYGTHLTLRSGSLGRAVSGQTVQAPGDARGPSRGRAAAALHQHALLEGHALLREAALQAHHLQDLLGGELPILRRLETREVDQVHGLLSGSEVPQQNSGDQNSFQGNAQSLSALQFHHGHIVGEQSLKRERDLTIRRQLQKPMHNNLAGESLHENPNDAGIKPW